MKRQLHGQVSQIEHTLCYQTLTYSIKVDHSIINTCEKFSVDFSADKCTYIKTTPGNLQTATPYKPNSACRWTMEGAEGSRLELKVDGLLYLHH